MKKVNILRKQRVFSDFLCIDEFILQHETKEGVLSRPLRRLVGERGDSCAALVLDTDTQEFIMVEQFRPPTLEKGPGWLVELVAGSVNPGENPSDCIKREIEEEIGYAPAHLEPIANFYTSPGGSSERMFLFYAEVDKRSLKNQGGGLEEEHEDITILRKSPKAWWEDLSNGLLPDAKTIIALQWWREKFKI